MHLLRRCILWIPHLKIKVIICFKLKSQQCHFCHFCHISSFFRHTMDVFDPNLKFSQQISKESIVINVSALNPESSGTVVDRGVSIFVSTVEVLCTPAYCEEDILLLQVQAYGRAALVASYSLKQITKPYLDRE